MHSLKVSLVVAFILMPLFAAAHGEEVFFVLAIYPLSIILFLVTCIFLPLTNINKVRLGLVYFTALIVIFFSTSFIPYNDNKEWTTPTIMFAPFIVVIIAYAVLKGKEENYKR